MKIGILRNDHKIVLASKFPNGFIIGLFQPVLSHMGHLWEEAFEDGNEPVGDILI